MLIIIQILEINQPAKILESRVGDVRGGDTERAQPGEAPNVGHSGIGDARSDQAEALQMCRAAQMPKAGVGDRRLIKVQHGEAGENGFQTFEACIADPRLDEPDRVKSGQTVQAGQSAIGDGGAAEIDKFRAGQPLQVHKIGVCSPRVGKADGIGLVKDPHAFITNPPPQPGGTSRNGFHNSPDTLNFMNCRPLAIERDSKP